jgi:hypothetical protein
VAAVTFAEVMGVIVGTAVMIVLKWLTENNPRGGKRSRRNDDDDD